MSLAVRFRSCPLSLQRHFTRFAEILCDGKEAWPGVARLSRWLQSSDLTYPSLGVAYAAVIFAIGKVDDQTNNQPYNQAGPVDPPQFVHHVAIEGDAKNRHQRHQRGAERSRLARI